MNSLKEKMVGRKSEYSIVSEFITQKDRGPKILGINGSGGIGKTYLLDMVLNDIQPGKNSTIVFKVDGSQEDSSYDFIGIFKTLLANLSLPESISDKTKTFFPKTQTVIKEYYRIMDNVQKEIERTTSQEDVKALVKRLILLGKVVNRSLLRDAVYAQIIAEILNSELLHDKTLEEAFDLIDNLKSLRESLILPEFLQNLFGIQHQAKIKTDLFGILAESMYRDLEKLYISTPLAAQPFFDKVLIILDDFENIGKVLSDFIIGRLVPTFRNAPYSVGFLILGRDSLESMHPGFKQHLSGYIEQEIPLSPFTEKEAVELLTNGGFSEAESLRIYQETYGYPYLISLIIEGGTNNKPQPAVYLDSFYERTSRWMNAIQKKWFSEVCYLNAVNHETLKIVFPRYSEEQIEEVMNWFRKESSIRDRNDPNFTVNPLIRRKILELNSKLIGPKTHQEKLKKCNAYEQSVGG